MVRKSLAVLVLSIISGCASVTQQPEAALAPETQTNSWAASVTSEAEGQKAAPTEKKEQEDCLRSSSIMALWSCEKGINPH